MVLSRLLTPIPNQHFLPRLDLCQRSAHVARPGDHGLSDTGRRLDDTTARSAFTVNLLIAWFLATVLFFSSPLIADFFNESGLSTVLRILTITFLLLAYWRHDQRHTRTRDGVRPPL